VRTLVAQQFQITDRSHDPFLNECRSPSSVVRWIEPRTANAISPLVPAFIAGEIGWLAHHLPADPFVVIVNGHVFFAASHLPAGSR
jgi:hypothetical protein